MDENAVKIVVAIIGLIGTLIGGFSTYFVTSKKQAIQDAKREQNQNDKFDFIITEIGGVKKRLDEHNHYAERFTENAKDIAIMNERQKSLATSIEKIQKDIDYLKSDRCKV